MTNSFFSRWFGNNGPANEPSQSSTGKRRRRLIKHSRRQVPRFRRTLNGCEGLERREMLSGDAFYAGALLISQYDDSLPVAIVASPDTTAISDSQRSDIVAPQFAYDSSVSTMTSDGQATPVANTVLSLPSEAPLILIEPDRTSLKPVPAVADAEVVDQVFFDPQVGDVVLHPQAQNTLPAAYEGFRQALGDAGLANMLRANKQQWGNCQGVCGTGIVEMQTHYPDLYQQFLETERQLENWLQTQPAPGAEQVVPQQQQNPLPQTYDALRQALGDTELAELLRRIKQKWGNYQGVCGTALVEMQRNHPDVYQQFVDTERQLENWLQGQGALPEFYETLRRALGDKALAEMLRGYKQQWGNYQGVCGTALVEMQQHYPDLYQKFLEAERQLENWLQGQAQSNSDGGSQQSGLPAAYESLRQSLGDRGLADLLRGNKRKWGNHQGICGTAIVEMQQHYPDAYRQFVDTERRLEEWLNSQSRVDAPSDYYYGNIPDGTADNTIAYDVFGDDIALFGCLAADVLVVQDDDPISDAIEKANELVEGLNNLETAKKVAEVLKQASEYAGGENPDPIGALKLLGEAIGLMKELAPKGMSDVLDAYASAIASIADALEKIPLTLYDRAIDKAYEETKDPQQAAKLADSFIPDAPAEDRERGIKRVTLRHLKSTHVPPKSFWDWEWFPWNWISSTPEVPALPCDYNGDSLVDSADYVVWRKNDGTQQGYDTWRANFGRTVDSGGVNTTPVDVYPLGNVGITGPCPPPVTDALRIYLIAEGWKEDAIEIRDEASRQAVEILRRERARIERQVEAELGPLAWAVFDITQPSAGESRQRELEAESPVYVLLREAANNHADPEVRARAQDVLHTVHPIDSGLPDGIFELPLDPLGPIAPPPAPAGEDVAVRTDTAIDQAANLDANSSGVKVFGSDSTGGLTTLQTEIVPLDLVGSPTLVQDTQSPAKLRVTDEWQFVIAGGKVTSITNNGKPHTGPLPKKVADDVNPVLQKVTAGMVGSLLVRYYEVHNSSGERVDCDGELKETITPAAGVATGGTAVKDGVVATPDRLFHFDSDKNFQDKTLLQLIEVSGRAVAYHKITITRTGVTVQVLTKQQYDEELKKQAQQ